MQDFIPDLTLFVQQYVLPLVWKVLGALVLWIVGGMLIGLSRRLLTRAMAGRGLDPTFSIYLNSALGVLLRIILLVAVLGIFGVESTSFAAILAAAGIAIGMAWSGLLANFAAGLFLVVLRPFKVGDVIGAAGVIGLVSEIGLFVTTVDTIENIRIFIGNNKLFADNIVNYSSIPIRRVEARAQIAHGVDAREVGARLVALLKATPNVVAEPAPSVDILEFNAAGCVLYVRPYCNGSDYFQVLDATQRAIAEVCSGLPIPAPHAVQYNK